MNHKRIVDVQDFIDRQRFSLFQWTILVLCFLVVAADGFDTAAVGFIAPSLVRDWGITRTALGPVMSAALVGLGIGALVAGPIADRIGRKTVVVLSVLFFGVWSVAAAHATSIGALTLLRFMTGLGLGAAMPNSVTLMSEYAPSRIRSVVVNTMYCGFSAGVALGGMASAWLIPHHGWQSVLMTGGLGPLVLTVFLIMLLPESAQFMVARGRDNGRIKRVLSRIATSADLEQCSFASADATANRKASALGVVLSSRYRAGTVMLWLAYFMGLLIYYLLTNWMPTLFKDMGLSDRGAALMTSLFPIGGVLGNLCVGWLMDIFKPNRVIASTYAITAALVILVRHGAVRPVFLGMLIFLTGTVATSAVTSMATLAAGFYPTHGRATGVSWMLGVGRIGGVAGALVGAALMGLGWQFGSVFSLLAVPALMGGIAVYAVGRPVHDSSLEENKLAPAVE